MSLLLMLYMTLALNMGHVYAATPEDVKLNALVKVEDGTVYYESADQAGSGKNARTVNIYTSDKLYIGGYAILSQDSRLVSYEAYLRDDAKKQKDWKTEPKPEDLEQLWVHLYSKGFNEGSIGWVSIKNVHIIPSEPEIGIAHTLPMPTPQPIPQPAATTLPQIPIPPETPDRTPATTGSIEAVAQAIEEASENGKVALLLDASGSVSKWSEEIASYAKDMDVDTTIIFGYRAIEISPDEYTEKQWDTGCASVIDFFFRSPTNIPLALNSLPDEAYDNVIIVTDTYNNGNDSINERNNIGSVTVVSTVVEEKIDSEIIQDIKTSWGVEPEIQFLESK